MWTWKEYKKVVWCLALSHGLLAYAWENRCNTRRTGEVQGICKGFTIPASKARNFHSDSHQLVCSGNVDHFLRRPQKYDINKWVDTLKIGYREDAQKIRRESQPDIQWSGVIPYQTVEVWTWEDCRVGTDGFHCGYDTKYRTEYYTVSNCSGSGKNRSCRSESRSRQVSYQEPRTCLYDHIETESVACSHEKINYTAQYQRPTPQEWNPKTAGYIDALPNKYDLLPGELEDVQIFNSKGNEHVIHPYVVVGDAWNEYRANLQGTAVNGLCQQDSNYNLKVTLQTVKRIPNKATPNAFRLPVDPDGKPIDPIIWASDLGIQGRPLEKAYPALIQLDDTASTVISTLAQVSKEAVTERETMKAGVGIGTNSDGMKTSDFNKDPQFFKNTVVRVQLLKHNKYIVDTQNTKELFTEDIYSLAPTMNVLSNDQEIASSDFWKVLLSGNREDPVKNNIYITKIRKSIRSLKPGQEYILRVSMYQRGAVGLYKQDCSVDTKAWDCQWYALFLKRDEDDYFSKPLEIKFSTDTQLLDKRGFWDKLVDFIK